MTKILAFADNDVTSDAEEVNAAMLKETNVDLYAFVGDGPYSESGTEWVSMMKQSFDDKKAKLIFSRGNHDEDESESKQTQKDIEAWFPEAKGIAFEDTWLSSKQVGNVYVISMDTQDLDIEFERDQFNWVESELVKAKQLRTEGKVDWIVILFHKPFFTLKSSHSPYTAVRFLYREIFRDAQVDFCISGHNHNTQFWFPMVPSDSQANGEGKQLFSYASDNKTFDFSKDHGQLYIVTGHAGHEWNSINDSGAGVTNVQFYGDSGNFGYTCLETNGKKVKVMSKDTANKVLFEYNVSRENGIVVEPEPCKDNECKDPVTNQCRAIATDEVKDSNGFCKKKEEPDPDPTTKKCPKDYEFDPSLGHCIPLIEPNESPNCGEGYTWNPVTKVCDKDDGGPDPEPGNPIAKLELPTKVEPKQTDVIADASASTADTVEITETTSEGIQLIDTGEKWKKKFNIPDKNNFSIGIQAIAKKGTKQSVIQKSIQVSTTGPDPDPDPNGEIDEHGIKWLVAKVSSPKTIVEMSRDEATDDRWSGNVTGLRNGFEAVFIGKSMDTSGDAHFAMKQFSGNHSGSGADKNAWYDTGLRQDGTIQLQTEYPHPNNHDFTLSDSEQFIKKISKNLEGNWIGLKWCVVTMKPNGTRQDGIRCRMWVDEDPLDANNKPKNGWKLVYDFIDTGQVIPADKQLVDEQDCEVRRSDTGKHDIYGDGKVILDAKEGAPGLHVRPIP